MRHLDHERADLISNELRSLTLDEIAEMILDLRDAVGAAEDRYDALAAEKA